MWHGWYPVKPSDNKIFMIYFKQNNSSFNIKINIINLKSKSHSVATFNN